MQTSLIRCLFAGASILASFATFAQAPQSLKICSCWVTGLSADGSAAAGNMDSTNSIFRWTLNDGLQLVGIDVNAWTTVHVFAGEPRISDDGNVVVGTIVDSTRTFATEGRWVKGAGWQQLDLPLPPDGGVMDFTDSSVWGLSGDGSVVTGLYWVPANGSAHASAWTAGGGMVGLPVADRSSSRIDGANRDGRVLAGWESNPDNGTWQATAWVSGARTLLDNSGNWSIAEAVNRNGDVIVGQAFNPVTGREEAALWHWNGSSWTQTSLGAPAGTSQTGSSYANAVSDDGSVVVGFYAKRFGPMHNAFLWTPTTGAVDLTKWLVQRGLLINPRKLKLIDVSGVSADGHILAVVAQEQTGPFYYESLLIKY